MLLDFAHEGCPAKTGNDWSLELLDEAVQRGANPSARNPVEAAALISETMRKVDEGFARILPWKVLRDQLPTKLKVSPIAAIPYKNRLFRMMLNLSYGFRLDDVDYPSVNDGTTDEATPIMSVR